MTPGYDLCPSVSMSLRPSRWPAQRLRSKPRNCPGWRQDGCDQTEYPGISPLSASAWSAWPDWCHGRSPRRGASDKDLPGFRRIKKAVVGPERYFGLVDLHHPLQRLARGIDRRSFCASNQAVLYGMPSWASNWSADMPLEWVAMRCAAQNHTVRGNWER